MNETMTLDRANMLIDEVVPKYLSLSGMKMKEALSLLPVIFKKSEQAEHLQEHWEYKNGEFGSFYLNLDAKHQRMLLEFFGIKVEAEKYPDAEERIMAMINGISSFEIYPFETHMLHQFLLMANNNSIEIVENMPNGQLLIRYLEQSQVNPYGTGVNWGKYYQYLMKQKATERKAVVEFAYSFK
jgi:hypothetical protein